MAKKRTSKKNPSAIFQFRITLLDVTPAIWRRVQVIDCSLDEFHEHIQTSMGWTNSHLHQFEIGDVCYGDAELLEDAFDPVNDEDSRMVKLSELLLERRKGFRFRYVYDFGDHWLHKIEFEGMVAAESNVEYPICMDGARASPPEDCGGAPGYDHLLEVLASVKHPEYHHLREWASGFDPEEFSTAAASLRMHQGLPDWRSMK